MLVAGPPLEAEYVVFQQPPDRRALRQQRRQSLPDELARGEQLQLAAEAAVVAPLRIRARLDPGVQLLLRGEERAVDALQHRAALVAAPVGARRVREREGADLPRALRVSAAAEVVELRMAEVADGLILDLVDQFQLVGLLREDRARLVLGDPAALDRHVALHGAAHPPLDAGEILGRERTRQLEVVVEAVLDRRADRVLALGEHLDHGLGQDVRGGVAHAEEALLRRQRLQRRLLAVVLGEGPVRGLRSGIAWVVAHRLLLLAARRIAVGAAARAGGGGRETTRRRPLRDGKRASRGSTLFPPAAEAIEAH